MKVTFILPAVGRKSGYSYVASWQMEPLAIAVLSALTPPNIEKVFFDDRLEEIDYHQPTDLVALSVETYTARRAYQIAQKYRDKGVKVVMGGFHPTLAPEDALQHADAVVLGEAEETWPQLLADFQAGCMKQRYRAQKRPSLAGRFPDRSIYREKKYQPIALVETARGCCFNCEFCSITRFYQRSHENRPVSEVASEIAQLGKKYVFFTDDNIAANKPRFRELLTALLPLKISWSAQSSIDIAQDNELLELMHHSGCVCVLIGFESLRPAVLQRMDKSINSKSKVYESALAELRKHGIGIYGTFVFGYDGDNISSFQDTLNFARRHSFFFTAFNHLVPFPGTALYQRLQDENRLLFDKWWLSENYRFGDIAFKVEGMSEEQLREGCLNYRKRFYSLPSIIRRMANWRANCCSLSRALLYLSLNFLSAREVKARQSLPLGILEEAV